PAVERVVVMRVVVRRHVPDDQPAVPVDLEVDLLQGAVPAGQRRVHDPADDDEEEGDSTAPDKARARQRAGQAAGQGAGPLRVAFTFALRCATDRIHTGNDIGSRTRASRASPGRVHTGNHANADAAAADRAGSGVSTASLVSSGPLLLALPVAAAA